MTEVQAANMAQESDDATRQWRAFIQNSLRLRLNEDRFRQYVEELGDRVSISGRKLAFIVVENRRATGKIVDPRIPVFVEQLLEANMVNSYDILAALFRDYSVASEAGNGKPVSNVCELASNLLDHLTRCFVSAKSPRSIPETRHALLVLSTWLETVASAANDGDALMQSLDHSLMLLYDSLGQLAIAMLENVRVGGVIEKAITPGRSGP